MQFDWSKDLMHTMRVKVHEIALPLIHFSLNCVINLVKTKCCTASKIIH